MDQVQYHLSIGSYSDIFCYCFFKSPGERGNGGFKHKWTECARTEEKKVMAINQALEFSLIASMSGRASSNSPREAQWIQTHFCCWFREIVFNWRSVCFWPWHCSLIFASKKLLNLIRGKLRKTRIWYQKNKMMNYKNKSI